jgi:hypothetical protein
VAFSRIAFNWRVKPSFSSCPFARNPQLRSMGKHASERARVGWYRMDGVIVDGMGCEKFHAAKGKS